MARREPGIPTTHRHTRFRSRLEARWATFFDAIGWRWEYEPFDLDGYIPDFAILGARPLLVEVKPALTLAELYAHTTKVERAERDALIVGATPMLPGTTYAAAGYPVAGVLIQWSEWDDRHDASAAEAHWFNCIGGDPGRDPCNATAVYQTEQSWVGYPCGHYDGDGHIAPVAHNRLERAWAESRNTTQWRP